VDSLTDQLVGWLVDRPTGHPTDGWLAGWWNDGLVGWLAG